MRSAKQGSSPAPVRPSSAWPVASAAGARGLPPRPRNASRSAVKLSRSPAAPPSVAAKATALLEPPNGTPRARSAPDAGSRHVTIARLLAASGPSTRRAYDVSESLRARPSRLVMRMRVSLKLACGGTMTSVSISRPRLAWRKRL